MRRLSLAAVMVLLFSAGALAQSVAVSGGVYLGSQRIGLGGDPVKSSALGFYASADAKFSGAPVVVSGSFATVSPDEVSGSTGSYAAEHTVSTFDLLIAYRLHPHLAVGVGWISATLDVPATPGIPAWTETAQGFALGVSGEYPVAAGVQARGKLLYAPSAESTFSWGGITEKEPATMLGLVLSVSYSIADNFSVEGGYRFTQFTVKEIDDVFLSTGGLFVGVTYSF